MVVKTKPWFFYQLLVVCITVGTTITARAATPPEYWTIHEWEILVFGLCCSIFFGAVIGLFGGVPKGFEDVKPWPDPVRFIAGLCTGVGFFIWASSGSGLTPFVLIPSFLGAFTGQFVILLCQKALLDMTGKTFGGGR